MKRTFILICIFALCLCGCRKNNVETTDTSKQIIVFPTEQTVATLNGYKAEADGDNTQNKIEYIGNSNSKKFHLCDCQYTKNIKQDNVVKSFDRNKMINDGYAPCQNCKP